MIQNSLNSNELLRNAIEGALFPALVSQVKKDFLRANIPIEVSQDLPPEVLVRILHEKIYHLMMEKFPEYLNLLYIVDVPEREFKEIQVTDVVEVAGQVTFLVLKREWQKVWLKNKYA